MMAAEGVGEADVGALLRRERVRRRWNQAELAGRAGVSRTTVCQIEQGAVATPHAATVSKLFQALELNASGQPDSDRGKPADVASIEGAVSQAAFECDRATNPAVRQTFEAHREWFQNWDGGDWDELVSSFGCGGGLNEIGVAEAARAINQRKEIVQKLRVVLDTHLGAAAIAMIDALYREATDFDGAPEASIGVPK